MSLFLVRFVLAAGFGIYSLRACAYLAFSVVLSIHTCLHAGEAWKAGAHGR